MISNLIVNLTLVIDSIIGASSLSTTADIGIMVYDLKADSCLYEKNAQHVMRPASTTKLITGITALDVLSKDYEYKTNVFYTGHIDTTRYFCPEDSTTHIKRGHLKGDVYIIGVMDPKIDNNDLKAMAKAIYNMGIDTITGHVYGDASFMYDERYGLGWCWDDDNPELSAMLFNREEALLSKFVSAVRNEGIVIMGGVAERKCPNTKQFLTSISHSIEDIMIQTMKESNNTFAETLLYHVGYTKGKPSTRKKSISVEEALMEKIYLSAPPQLTHNTTSVPSHRLADGSGLSLYNYLSPEIEVAFLRYAYNQENIYPYLRKALPIAGYDGTLSDRMRDTEAQYNVHAKTGTVSGVISLAGYCEVPDRNPLAFSIIINGCLNSKLARNLQDKICTILCK